MAQLLYILDAHTFIFSQYHVINICNRNGLEIEVISQKDTICITVPEDTIEVASQLIKLFKLRCDIH